LAVVVFSEVLVVVDIVHGLL
jgi:hypothetical protein